MKTLKIDKTKPVFRYCIRIENGAPAILKVEDVMRCIDTPGDFGWVEVSHEKPSSYRFIANFEQLFDCWRDAKQELCAMLRTRIAEAESLLHLAEELTE